MKRDYQDDSSFSSWYPDKPVLKGALAGAPYKGFMKALQGWTLWVVGTPPGLATKRLPNGRVLFGDTYRFEIGGWWGAGISGAESKFSYISFSCFSLFYVY